MFCCRKNINKSIQNRPKILPKSFKMEVWRGSGQLLGVSGLQEASQTLLRRLLDAFGEPLGPISGRSYRVLEAFEGAGPGRSWSVLERLGKVLGQIFLLAMS